MLLFRQCSECVDNHDKDDNKQTVDPDEPRKLRYLNKPAKSPYFLNNVSMWMGGEKKCIIFNISFTYPKFQ